MIKGSCHCGTVHWTFDGVPDYVNACNCTVCRRYGVLWAYDWEAERITATGPTQMYAWGDKGIGFHFCATCGCVAYWRGTQPHSDGRRRMAVNVRLAEPEVVGQIPVHHFDGLVTFREGPRDDRCVSDMWY